MTILPIFELGPPCENRTCKGVLRQTITKQKGFFYQCSVCHQEYSQLTWTKEELELRYNELPVGTRVRTASVLEPQDFSEWTLKTRTPNVVGTIEAVYNGHGLCYKVRHGQTCSWYNPEELTLV